MNTTPNARGEINNIPNASFAHLEQPSVTLGDGVLRRESGRHGPVDDPEPVETVRVLCWGHVSRAFLSAQDVKQINERNEKQNKMETQEQTQNGNKKNTTHLKTRKKNETQTSKDADQRRKQVGQNKTQNTRGLNTQQHGMKMGWVSCTRSASRVLQELTPSKDSVAMYWVTSDWVLCACLLPRH